MGTPLPPNEPGITCARCSGAGDPFNGIPTPKYLIVKLFDLEQGEFWDPDRANDLLSPFWVPQVSGCAWQLITSDWDVTVLFGDVSNTIAINDRIQVEDVFDDVTGPDCTLEWTNQIVIPTGNYAFNGIARITWQPFS